MTEYKKDFVADFAERTFRNLKKIGSFNDVSKNKGFEVTQLINSFIGLLIFLQQEQQKEWGQKQPGRDYFGSKEFYELPFPNDNIEASYYEAVKNNPEYLEHGSPFQKMIRHLRNAVAHQSLQVEPLESVEKKVKTRQITGFRFTDADDSKSKSITFSLTIEDIYNILMSMLYRIVKGIKDGKKEDRVERFMHDAKGLAEKYGRKLDIDGVRNYVDQH